MKGPSYKDKTRRYEIDAEVVSHERIIGHEFEIVFRAPEIAVCARPGQFVELLFGLDYAPLVRRPFSIYRVNGEMGTFSILYLARGSFTTGLTQKRPGDRVSLLGPLGNGFRWTLEPLVKHVLVAGGIGAPPIYFLARELTKELSSRGSRSSVTVINAARTRDLLAGMQEFGGLDVTLHAVTDDGTEGIRGLATDLASTLLNDAQVRGEICRLYACGPTTMLRAVGALAEDLDIACQLSVETSMPCGIGLCQGCAIPIIPASNDPSAIGVIHANGSIAEDHFAVATRPDGPEADIVAVSAFDAPVVNRPMKSSNRIAEPAFCYSLACVEGPVFDSRCILWNQMR